MARIAFCQNIMVEYMGYMSMASVLKKSGHTVEIFIHNQSSSDEYIEEIKKFNPGIVGFSVLSPTMPWALHISRLLKKEINTLTIFGNVHAIINPEIINEEGIDIVCISEGELPIAELAECIDLGRTFSHIKGLWIKSKDGIIKNNLPDKVLNLDELPFSDRSIYDKYFFFRHSKYIRVSNGRGCPFRCTFCSNAFLANIFDPKQYVRKRKPELIIHELENLVKERKPKFIFFLDEVFWVDKNWLYIFLKLYKEKINIPFTANYRWGGGVSEDDVRLMKEANLKSLVVATETGDETQRMVLFNKKVKDDEILKLSVWLKKYKIDFVISAFFGVPGDTIDDHIKRIKFFSKIKATYLWTTFFQPYPGLALTESTLVKKYLPQNKVFDLTLHHNCYLNIPDKKQIENLKKIYFLIVKFPRLIPISRKIIQYNSTILFNFIFMIHFSFYIFKFEHISLSQFFYHIKVFAADFLKKK
jgi:anaerobic magnesium-protoporphyrin IX monomethyl ester cyclase